MRELKVSYADRYEDNNKPPLFNYLNKYTKLELDGIMVSRVHYIRSGKEVKRTFPISTNELKPLYEKMEKEYEKEVRALTELQPLHLIPNIEKRGKEYVLDHYVPIAFGFYNNINPEIISNYRNLQMLTNKENLRKSNKAPIDALETLEKIGSYVGFEIKIVL